MGGCASRLKESDMNEESVHNKLVSETIVDKENNTEKSVEQIKTEAKPTETTSVETKETSLVEPTKETTPSTGEAILAPKKVEEVVVVAVDTPKVAEETKKVEETTVPVAKPEKTENAVDTNVVKPEKEETKPAVTEK